MIKKIILLAAFCGALLSFDTPWSPDRVTNTDIQNSIAVQKDSINNFAPAALKNQISNSNSLSELANPTATVFDITQEVVSPTLTSISKVMLSVDKITILIDEIEQIFPREIITNECQNDSNNVAYCPENLEVCSSSIEANDGTSTEYSGTIYSCSTEEMPIVNAEGIITDCQTVTSTTTNVAQSVSCPSGYSNNGSQCEHSTNVSAQSNYSCPNGGSLINTNFNCSGTFPNSTISSWYTNHLCRCPDQAGYNYWLNEYNTNGYSYTWTAFQTSASLNGEWRNSCSSPNGYLCSETCYQSNYCPDGGYVSGSSCIKTCSSTVSVPPCTTNCVWWAGGVSHHTGCGQDFYDTWGEGLFTNYQGSCAGYVYPMPDVTTNYNCSYDASPGFYYDCSYFSSLSYSCPNGTLSGSECIITNYIPQTIDNSCSSGENNLECSVSISNVVLESLYKNHLCRCPDQAGYNYWLSQLNNGMSYEDLTATFKNSAIQNNQTFYTSCSSINSENTSCSGNFPNTQLFLLYKEHLCRCPDQAGYDYWLNRWNNGYYSQFSNLENTFKNSVVANNETWNNSCSSLNQNTCVSSIVNTQNPDEEDYLYYTYECPGVNYYGEEFIVQNPGGEQYTNPLPPINNCLARTYLCDSNPNHVCSDIDGTWECSSNECNSNNMCGSATCINGVPDLQMTQYTTSPLNGIDATTICNDTVCDVVVNDILGGCLGESACPTAFGVYKKDGSCYQDVCPPEATVKDLGHGQTSCLSLQCPSSFIENASGKCDAQ